MQVPGVDAYTGAPVDSAGIQTAPVLTTAYGDACVYFSINAKPGGVYVLRDAAGQTEADMEMIYEPDEADSNSTAAAFAPGDDGTIYYTNDSGLLLAVGKAQPDPVADADHRANRFAGASQCSGRHAGTRDAAGRRQHVGDHCGGGGRCDDRYRSDLCNKKKEEVSG